MPRKVHASESVAPQTTATPPLGPEPGKVTAAPAPPPGPDWAKEVVDRLDEVVVKIRSNTTDRLVKLARLIVLGLLAAIFGTTAGVLFLIALVRVLNAVIPGPVWEVHLLLGAIFTAGGVFLWSKKSPRPAKG